MTTRATFGSRRALDALVITCLAVAGCGSHGPVGGDCEDNTYCADGRYQCPADEAEPYFEAQTSGVVELEVGSFNACVRLTDGSLRCWGRVSTDINTPPAEMGAVADVDVGLAHACAVDNDGAVWCWGDPIGGSDGQTDVPADLPASLAVVTGYQFSCALLVSGGVRCWGLVSASDTPVIAGVSNAVQITAGRAHGCALHDDGAVTCWGDSIEGRAAAQVPADLEAAQYVTAGAGHTCIIATSGAARCWGSATFPHSELFTDDLLLLAAGSSLNCSVHRNGRFECWGGPSCYLLLVPDELGMVVGVDTSRSQACAIDSDGTLLCWGDLEPTMMIPSDIAP